MARADKRKLNVVLDDLQGEIRNIGNLLSKTLKEKSSEGITAGFHLGTYQLSKKINEIAGQIDKDLSNAFKNATKNTDVSRNLKLMQDSLRSLTRGVGDPNFSKLTKEFDAMLNDVSKTEIGLEGFVEQLKNAIEELKNEDKVMKSLNKSTDQIKNNLTLAFAPMDKMASLLGKIPIIGKTMGNAVTRIKTQAVAAMEKELAAGKGGVEALGAGLKTLGKGANPYILAIVVAIGIAIGLVYILFQAWSKVQKAVQKVADDTGIVNEQLKQAQSQIISTTNRLAQYGVTLESAGAAWTSIFKIQGVTGLQSQELVDSTALMVSNLGMISDDAASALILFRAMGNATDVQAVSMAGAVTQAALLAGLAPGEILASMAKNSKFLMGYMRDSGKQAAILAMQTKRLGLSLETAGKSTQDLLEWDTSIEKEMNATVMLGRQINFQKARMLAFEGRIAESQQAVFEQLPKLAEWNRLNFIQKKAIAEAAGMEVDEIGKSLKQQKLISELSQEDQNKYKYAIESLEKMKELDGESILRDTQKQTALTKFTQAWDGLITQLTLALVPIFEKYLLPAMETMTVWLRDMGKTAGTIKSIFSPLIEFLRGIGEGLDYAFKSFISIGAIKLLKSSFESLSESMKGSGMIEFFKIFGQTIGYVAGTIITLLALIVGFIAGAWSLFASLINFFVKLSQVLRLWLVKPWKDAWDEVFGHTIWSIETILGVFNPIVEAIRSVGTFLFDVITWPFKAAFEFLTEFIPNKVKSLIEAIRNTPGIGVLFRVLGIGDTAANISATAPGAAPAQAVAGAIVEKTANVLPANPASETVVLDEKKKLNEDVVNKLDELIALFKTSGWAVNIDGKKAGDLILANYPGPGVMNPYSS